MNTKEITMHPIRLALVAASLAALTACGGGGDSTDQAAGELVAATVPTTESAPATRDAASSPNHTVMTMTGDLVFEHDGPGGSCSRQNLPDLGMNGTSYEFSGTTAAGETFSLTILEYESDGEVDSVLLSSSGDRSWVMNAVKGPDGTITVDPDAKGAEFDLTLQGWTHDGSIHLTGSIACP